MKTRLIFRRRFLMAYSGTLTLALVFVVFSGFRKPKNAVFESITVQRIDVVEPDGTTRLIISSKARFPGFPYMGKMIPHPRGAAGMIFIDDEGTEIGGLIYGGEKDKDGKETANLHLSFDRYHQDQVFNIHAGQYGDKRSVLMAFHDRPDYDIIDMITEAKRIEKLPKEEQKAAREAMSKRFPPMARRILFGRDDDRSVLLKLKDTKGRDRLVLQVAPDGTPSLEFLDEKGKTVQRLPASKR